MSVNFRRIFWYPQFFQKTNKNNSTWGIVVLLGQFFCFFVCFLEELKTLTFRKVYSFDPGLNINTTLSLSCFRNGPKYVSIVSTCQRLACQISTQIHSTLLSSSDMIAKVIKIVSRTYLILSLFEYYLLQVSVKKETDS